jgi:signal transduction histidine kinase
MGQLDIGGSAVIDALDQPTVVVDDGTIIDCNDAYRALVDDSDPASLETSLGEYPALLEQIRSAESGIVSVDDENRYYHVRTTAVSDESGTRVGDLAVLQDVTAQQRKHNRLEQQNEQLDKFASLISHDLRNPLDVALGHTTALEELVDDPQTDDHFAELNAALSRMRQIIQNVLTLARRGEYIDDTASVALADIARTAWAHVDTSGGSLSVETDATVLADEKRLVQVFENLFRNALEHGQKSAQKPIDNAADRSRDAADRHQPESETSTLSVTVGDLDDGGFYVADDGVGIPAAEWETVFEAGCTGDGGNTGLGLAIVRKIADAHGWEVTVTSGDGGGARFEFHGVDAPATAGN